MTSPRLDHIERSRLVKLAGMLGSNRLSERAVAGLRSTELLSSIGTSWAERLASLPTAVAPRYLTRPETRQAAARMGLSL